MSFYITLPSNASMKILPGNNLSKFSVTALELNDQYEIGVAEIQFPNSYFNVNKGEVYEPSDEPKRDPPVLVKLPPCLYNSVEDFINDMNSLLSKTNSIIEIRYNKTTKIAIIRLKIKVLSFTSVML